MTLRFQLDSTVARRGDFDSPGGGKVVFRRLLPYSHDSRDGWLVICVSSHTRTVPVRELQPLTRELVLVCEWEGFLRTLHGYGWKFMHAHARTEIARKYNNHHHVRLDGAARDSKHNLCRIKDIASSKYKLRCLKLRGYIQHSHRQQYCHNPILLNKTVNETTLANTRRNTLGVSCECKRDAEHGAAELQKWSKVLYLLSQYRL